MGIFRDILSGLLDLVYPPFCQVCGSADDGYFCKKCRDEVTLISPPVCRRCGIPTPRYYCEVCDSGAFEFDSCRSAAVYSDSLAVAIKAFKYKPVPALADSLAEIMIQAYPFSEYACHVDLVVAVPISRARLAERSFNQVDELASRLCREIDVPYLHGAIVKHKETAHQANLTADLRAVNLLGSFSVPDPIQVSGKRVLIVDDVFTTGGTLNEVALTLRRHGALEVRAYTLARSMPEVS